MNYKLRAECINDATKLIEKNYSVLRNINLTRIKYIPDIEMEFESDLPIGQIIVLLKNIFDGHVMYQTVKPIDEYTGERNYDL